MKKQIIYFFVILIYSCSDPIDQDIENCIEWNRMIDEQIEEINGGLDKISFESRKKIVKLELLKCDIE